MEVAFGCCIFSTEEPRLVDVVVSREEPVYVDVLVNCLNLFL